MDVRTVIVRLLELIRSTVISSGAPSRRSPLACGICGFHSSYDAKSVSRVQTASGGASISISVRISRIHHSCRSIHFKNVSGIGEVVDPTLMANAGECPVTPNNRYARSNQQTHRDPPVLIRTGVLRREREFSMTILFLSDSSCRISFSIGVHTERDPSRSSESSVRPINSVN